MPKLQSANNHTPNNSEGPAKRLGERLEDRVIKEVFLCFASGFTEDLKSSNLDITGETLAQIHQGALTLRRRSRFLLYAESRNMFPVHDAHGFCEKSLRKLIREIAEAGGQAPNESPDKLRCAYQMSSQKLYHRLTELFRLVGQGDAPMSVPCYGGGLFLTDPDDEDDTFAANNGRFLRDHKMSDLHLALGLDMMARDSDEEQLKLESIDYKLLGVRLPGSIYERVLELKTRVAPENLAIVKEKGREAHIPFGRLDNEGTEKAKRGCKIVRKGQVYLANDKRERKAVGSYYMPDHIVKYIVEHTVGPVLEDKFERMRPAFREAQKTLEKES